MIILLHINVHKVLKLEPIYQMKRLENVFKKYQKLSSNEKEIIIIASQKLKKKLNQVNKRKEPDCSIKEPLQKKKEVSVNTILKESNLSEERTKVVTNVMLISQKHHCEEMKDLVILMEHKLATIDESSAFPMFINKKTKVNKTSIQTSTPTSQYAFCPYPFPFYNYNSSTKFHLSYHPQSSLTLYHNNSQATIF
ncbi:hypothetical protein GLOIN_2v1880776 [Rhizophagus clarus]|uniref:Uncharacterized protein n=1 Tax=Rhizophagus clarus TaxID=94130 RepID=A0A8H3LMU2_9GLOM|nr:hypothetical protein GLOIN_2v1880776 [Rhizophagus clarus]